MCCLLLLFDKFSSIFYFFGSDTFVVATSVNISAYGQCRSRFIWTISSSDCDQIEFAVKECGNYSRIIH